MQTGAPIDGLREVLTTMFAFPQNNDYFCELLSGLFIDYDLAGEHPIVGRRMPDIDITTQSDCRTTTLLHSARSVLLDFSDDRRLRHAAQSANDVRYVSARSQHHEWTLPSVGSVASPTAVFIRPDGYVAWAADDRPNVDTLNACLRVWCGSSNA